MVAIAKKYYLLPFFLASLSTTALADSEAMRKKAPLSLNLHVTGGNPPLVPGLGISYSFGPRFDFGIQAFKGSGDLRADFKEKVELPTGMTLSKADIDAQQGILVMRFLPGNSFSILFASGYRQDKVNYAFLNSGLQWDFSAVLTRETVIASAGIGNQWTFDNGVNFGIDWAIFSWKLASKSNTALSSRGLTTEEAETLDRSLQFWTSDVAKSTPELAVVYTVGYRF